MRSIVLFTEEMDDLETGVAELFEKFDDFQLQSNSVGIIYAHPDTDFQELMELLGEKFDFPIIGCTAMSMVTNRSGFATQGIALQIMTGDDVSFSVAITDEFDRNNVKGQIEQAYNEAAGRMPEKEKLIFTLLSSFEDDIPDEYIKILDKASGNVKTFGALASDEFSFNACKVFLNDRLVDYGMVLLLIGGNIRPIMEYEYTVSNEASYSAIVTKAEGNVIYKLGDKTFVDAMRDIGIFITPENAFNDCIGTPFILTYINEQGDQLSAMRTLISIDPDNGSAMFKGRVPEGAKLNICLINRTDVHDSVARAAEKCYKQFYANMADGTYKYSTVILISCASRLMTFANDIQNESTEYIKNVPPFLSVSGMYSFGEICPTVGDMTGQNYNMFYNTTFTLLVL